MELYRGGGSHMKQDAPSALRFLHPFTGVLPPLPLQLEGLGLRRIGNLSRIQIDPTLFGQGSNVAAVEPSGKHQYQHSCSPVVILK